MAGKTNSGAETFRASEIYGIRKSKQGSNRCSASVLPCRINHDGPSNASKRYWNPRPALSGERVAYFRGRKLHGRAVAMPEGYQGVVMRKTNQKMEVDTREALQNNGDLSNGDDGEDEAESEPATRIMEDIASFEDIITWGHDSLTEGESDPYERGISEWIAFAKTIHSSSEDELAKGSVTSH